MSEKTAKGVGRVEEHLQRVEGPAVREGEAAAPEALTAEAPGQLSGTLPMVPTANVPLVRIPVLAGDPDRPGTGDPDGPGPGDPAPALTASAASAPAGPFARGSRMVRLEGFEEPHRMTDAELNAYRRRFATLFLDEATARRGGLGAVVRAVNVFGEVCALKFLRIPERVEFEDEQVHRERVALARSAFRAEYESHRSVSGLKGFPRLFGYAQVGDVPCIVMEWVEGVTLSAAARMLSVDEAGRIAPLVAARLGRDLFDMLIRLELVGDGFVHRDISPSNILVRTGHLTVAEQAAEGSFDLCLIDFGSSVRLDPMGVPGYTLRYAALRCATPSYAPPEMLTEDAQNLTELRKSEKIDVYAAASVLFELVCGVPPFALEGRMGESLYRIKMDEPPRPLVTAHHGVFRVADALLFEPEVEAAARESMLDLGDQRDASELGRALDRVDGQLSELLLRGLNPDQARRAGAEELRDGLAAFCSLYVRNVVRALHGKRLVPCTGEVPCGEGPSASRVNRMLGVTGAALSGAALLTVMCVTGLLLDGTSATVKMGALHLSGDVPAIAAAMALGLPALLGLIGRGRAGGTRAGFARASAGIVLAALALLALLSGTSFSGVDGRSPLVAALLLAAAAAWCPVVLEYATMSATGAVGADEVGSEDVGSA